MNRSLACSLAALTTLTLGGCGGGGSSPAPAPQPVAQSPAPGPAPAPAVAQKTWVDADCSRAGPDLPACSTDFSDNNARAVISIESGENVIQVQAHASSPIGAAKGHNSGGTGNKAIYALDFLHELKLADFPGISFAMKLDAPGTTLVDAYVTYTVSLTCDGTHWLNLITPMSVMADSTADASGYARYSATPSDFRWANSGAKPLLLDPNAPTPEVLLHSGYGPDSNQPLPLDALIAAYPNACIYNFSNPDPLGITPTPAVEFNLSDTRNFAAKQYWLKNIKIGNKVVF